ncbi:hypothetical protein ACFOUP_10940 [Belliella kenyensis]|uniref:Lipocalin-like domain-containing protein n=1 Tax=Belliella kenyensis TaxID=1472724 RepID=A0ABV8EKS0_9BACT|nr:hypothetical protein [Belliella kenyensis]MCH7403656.1 hypothetical protein [Belliella kenyensis]MDN3602190.1 hypothetical protein [Belliella kenyensis]
MKRMILAVLVAVIFSCNQEDREPQYNILGYWDVVILKSTLDGQVTAGSGTAFTERYIFNDDGTFIKFTTRNSKTANVLPEPLQALGHYKLEKSMQDEYVFELELTFQTNLILSNACSDVGKEFMRLTKDNFLVHDLDNSCGNIVLFYTKQTSKF